MTIDRAWFCRRPFAHRGWHTPTAAADAPVSSRPENSLPAFAAAVAYGLGIECDLQPAADGTPMVIHDATLERTTRSTGAIAALDGETLARIPLTGGSGGLIPRLDDVLALVAGRVPLLVEIKSAWRPPDPTFLGRIGIAVSAYEAAHPGALVVMSFDPAIMAALADVAPTVPRGLVSGRLRTADGGPWWADVLDDGRREQLRALADIDRVGARLVAYEVDSLPTPETHALRTAGVPVLAWTVRTPADWRRAADDADAAIFEGALPPEHARDSLA